MSFLNRFRPGDIAVVPDAGATAEALAVLLGSLGVRAHRLAPQDDFFLEVHRPDGSIEAGMTGDEWPAPPERTLLQLFTEDEAQERPDAGTRTAELRQRQVDYVAAIMHEVLFRRDPSSLTLAEQVTRMADETGEASRDALCRALLAEQFGARVPESHGPVTSGPHNVQPGEALALPSWMLPDGTRMLLVYCDIPAMAVMYPNDRFFSLPGRDALKIAERNGVGIVIANNTDGRQSWVGMGKEQVARMLKMTG